MKDGKKQTPEEKAIWQRRSEIKKKMELLSIEKLKLEVEIREIEIEMRYGK